MQKAYRMGRLVAGGHVTEDTAVSALLDACRVNGLDAEKSEAEIRDKVRRGMAAGAEGGGALAPRNGNGTHATPPAPAPPPEAATSPDADDIEVDKFPPLRTIADIRADNPQVPWLWEGYLAEKALTIVYGDPKVGKSTLIFHLLRALESGSPFLNLPTATTGAVYLSEEHSPTLVEKIDASGLEHTLFLTRQDLFDGNAPRSHLERGVYWAKRLGYRLLVIDTFAAWGKLRGDDENQSGSSQATMETYQWAASQGVAVLVIHHAVKAGGDLGGDTGGSSRRLRGSGAIAGAVEVIIELAKRRGEPRESRKRVLLSDSRFAHTPHILSIEHSEAGYIRSSDPGILIAQQDADRVLAAIVSQPGVSRVALTKMPGIRRETVIETLDELVRVGRVRAEGQPQNRYDPLRYHAL
jgi:hypothetical protein